MNDLKFNNSILGIKIGYEGIDEIINKTDYFLKSNKTVFFHIVNLNPEIFTIALYDKEMKEIINKSQALLIDGVGIKILSLLMGIASGEKLAGTDFIFKLLANISLKSKRVFFLGGSGNSAELTSQYFKKKFPGIETSFSPGAKKIARESNLENENIIISIKKFSPNILFVAYGPPYQEKWIYRNRNQLTKIACMGVGGSFNFYARKTIRAPKILRSVYLEWLWRFIFEPGRVLKKLPNYFMFIIISSKLILIKYFRILKKLA